MGTGSSGWHGTVRSTHIELTPAQWRILKEPGKSISAGLAPKDTVAIEIVLHYDPNCTGVHIAHKKKSLSLAVGGKTSRSFLLKIYLTLSPKEKQVIETALRPTEFFRQMIPINDLITQLNVIISIARGNNFEAPH